MTMDGPHALGGEQSATGQIRQIFATPIARFQHPAAYAFNDRLAETVLAHANGTPGQFDYKTETLTDMAQWNEPVIDKLMVWVLACARSMVSIRAARCDRARNPCRSKRGARHGTRAQHRRAQQLGVGVPGRRSASCSRPPEYGGDRDLLRQWPGQVRTRSTRPTTWYRLLRPRRDLRRRRSECAHLLPTGRASTLPRVAAPLGAAVHR